MSASRICGTCQQTIPKKNFARHQQEHRGTHKKTCEICDLSIRKSGWQKHVNSESHKTREITKQQQLLTGEPSDPRLSSEALRTANSSYGDAEVLMREFFDTPDAPLMHLSSTYATEIGRVGGLSDLSPERQTKATQIWASLGLRAPMIFSAAECWITPPLQDCFTDLLHSFSKHDTKVYCRGSPSEPLYPPPIHVVLQQLRRPNASSTMYAVNMVAESINVKIPARLQGQVPIYQDEDITTTTNITPKFSADGLHVDHGKHGIRLLNGGCIKLWALYPLTPNNLKHFSTAHLSNAAFIELQGQLEGGEFCVQTEDEAIYLPPGCIHSTYTLRGGLTPGIEFSTIECLEPAAQMWDLNSKGVKFCGASCYPFLEAIIMGIRSNKPNIREKALELLCPRYKKISILEPGNFDKVKQALPESCLKCGVQWAKH